MKTKGALELKYTDFLTSAIRLGSCNDRIIPGEGDPQYVLWALKLASTYYSPTGKQTSPAHYVLATHQLESDSMRGIQQETASAKPLYQQLMPMTSEMNMSLNEVWKLTKQQ